MDSATCFSNLSLKLIDFMTRPYFVCTYNSILAQKDKNFELTTHGDAVGSLGQLHLPSMKTTTMSSRASLATRDPTRVQNFEPLRRLIASTFEVSSHKPLGWISPRGRNDIGDQNSVGLNPGSFITSINSSPTARTSIPLLEAYLIRLL